MSASNSRSGKSPFLAFCGILGAIAFGAIVVDSVTTTDIAPLGAGRGAERKASGIELNTAGIEQLERYALLEEANGTYQIPIDQAIGIIAAEWGDPVDGRAKMNVRAEQAFKVVEPPAPAPSEYE